MDLEKRLQMCLLLDFYGNLLTDKQRDIVQMYYENDSSLAEIGEIFGISRQAVRDALKVSENLLIDFEQKLNFIAKHNDIKKSIDVIINNIDSRSYDLVKSELKKLSNNL